MAKELYWYEGGNPGDGESSPTPGVWHASDWNQTGRNWEGEGDPPLDQQGYMNPWTGEIQPQYTGALGGDGYPQQTPQYNSAVDYGTRDSKAEMDRANMLAMLAMGGAGVSIYGAGAGALTADELANAYAIDEAAGAFGGMGAEGAGGIGAGGASEAFADMAGPGATIASGDAVGAGALGAGGAGQIGQGALTAEQLGTAKEAAAKTADGATSFDRLLKGAATGTDLLKLGLGAAAVGAIAAENPDRTSTISTQFPEWYTQGSKNALALADQYAALGPDAVAPLSANENAAIQMAKDSAGNWKPLLDKSTGALDASTGYYDKAGELAASVPGYLDKATGQIDASMPYFKQAGALTASVPGYLDRAAGQVDAAMPSFGKAGQMADTVSSYLNRSGALADEAAGGIPSVNLSAYMNPYLDNVLAPIARRNEIAKAAALNDIKAKAGMRGAFGGSRSTLLESETSEAADRNLNEAEANIRSGAFTTGLNAAQADLARKLAASGQFGTLGNVAGSTANVYTNTGKAIADTAGVFNNMGQVATGAANSAANIGKGIADTAGTFNNMGAVAVGGANANTNIGRSLTDTATGYKANAGALGTLTDADIARLTSTGGIERGVEQAKLNAPLTAISGYANALRGSPGSTNTTVAPEASKTGQVVGALTALAGANKAGWL